MLQVSYDMTKHRDDCMTRTAKRIVTLLFPRMYTMSSSSKLYRDDDDEDYIRAELLSQCIERLHLNVWTLHGVVAQAALGSMRSFANLSF